MKSVCAWCKVVLGDKEPLDDLRTTHGICATCFKNQTSEPRTGDHMSYTCQICRQPSAPGAKLLRHVCLRADGSIAREVPVCGTCKRMLDEGRDLATVVRMRGPRVEVPPPLKSMPQVTPAWDDGPPAKPVFNRD